MISKDDYKAKSLSRIHGSRLEDFFFFLHSSYFTWVFI